MRDLDIRAALRRRLAVERADEFARVRVVEEMGVGVYGEVRVDVAVLADDMIGYELKSSRDTLKRLPKQVEWYSRVLDQAHIVVADNHLHEALTIIPAWWRCTVATTSEDGTVALQNERAAQHNPSIDSQALALLLWRSEVLNALEERGLDRGYRSKTRDE